MTSDSAPSFDEIRAAAIAQTEQAESEFVEALPILRSLFPDVDFDAEERRAKEKSCSAD